MARARGSLHRWGTWGFLLTATVFAGCSGAPGSGSNQGGVLGAPGQATPAGGGSTGANSAGGAGAGASIAAGSTIFAANYGDAGSQNLWGFATDASGNFYLGGVEDHPLQAGQPIQSDVFVLKYSPAGDLLWTQSISTTETRMGLSAIAVQPTTGAVILAGPLAGTVTIGGTALSSGNDPVTGQPALNVWMAAIDPAGHFLWSRAYASNAEAIPDQVFTTANGDIELVGDARDNASVGGAPLCCSDPAIDVFGFAFVARYSPTGDPIWSNAIGGDFGRDHFAAAAGADSDGGMVIGGTIHGTMTYQGESFAGGGGVSPAGFLVEAGVVMRLDGQGRRSWINVYPGPIQIRLDASLDPAGNVILFGQFAGTLDLGNGVSLDAVDNGQPFSEAGLLAKLGPDGTAQWVQQFPVSGEVILAQAVATDAAGNIALTGEAFGGAAVGGAPLPSGLVMFVAGYAADGAFRYSRGFADLTNGGISNRQVGVVFDPSGALGFAGRFAGTVDFGTGPLTAPTPPPPPGTGSPPLSFPPPNLFLLKLAP
jgi:hypothetical protein